MADTTPVYDLPYQELGDAPQGPNLGKDLAEAVETELVRIDASVSAIHALAPASGVENTAQPSYASATPTAGSQQCTAAFVAPPSGAVLIHWKAYFQAQINDKMAFVGCEVRTGSTPGGGSVVVASNSNDAIAIGGSVVTSVPLRLKGSTYKLVTGLTASNAYHARIMYQAESGGGGITVFTREVVVIPLL